MKRAAATLAVVIATCGALAVRVVIAGRGALADGDALAERGDLRGAITAWETAARWYLPGAPHVDTAYARLVDAARDPAHALRAWRAVRSASRATRALWTPHADDLAVADAKIAELSADDPARAAASATDRDARIAWLRSRLARDPRPEPGSALLAILGIAGFLGGIAVAVRRGIEPAGRVRRRPLLAGAAIAILGVAGWAAGLYNA